MLTWKWPENQRSLLSIGAVALRYAGESADPQEANAALDACKAYN